MLQKKMANPYHFHIFYSTQKVWFHNRHNSNRPLFFHNLEDWILVIPYLPRAKYVFAPEQATGMTFDSLIAHSFESKSGLNIETESLPTWLANAHELRRSKKFRSFEVDFHNGRYFLVTEHLKNMN